ncbi:hypothetical protein [Streptomyces sp. NBC_01530]
MHPGSTVGNCRASTDSPSWCRVQNRNSSSSGTVACSRRVHRPPERVPDQFDQRRSRAPVRQYRRSGQRLDHDALPFMIRAAGAEARVVVPVVHDTPP